MSIKLANRIWFCLAVIVFIIILPFLIIRYIAEGYSYVFDLALNWINSFKNWFITKLSK